jgi:hypothetical protein
LSDSICAEWEEKEAEDARQGGEVEEEGFQVLGDVEIALFLILEGYVWVEASINLRWGVNRMCCQFVVFEALRCLMASF